MNPEELTLEQLPGYIADNASRIYVRAQSPTTGKWGTYALTDLDAEDAIREAMRFIEQRRIPVVMRE